MKDRKIHAARTRDHLGRAIRGRDRAPGLRSVPAGAGPAGALAARHPARLVTIAVAVITCLALALTEISPAPARAAARSPQPPVIRYLPHPVLVHSLTQLEAQSSATSSPLVLICLSSADTHCLGTEAASARRANGAVGEILSAVASGVASGLVQILWKVVFGRGSDKDRGVITAEDEGGDGTQPSSMKDTCLGANPTPSDGNDRVYPSSPSKCFGVLRQSWLYTIEPGTKGNYDFISRAGEAEHRVFALAQLNLRNGAFLYVKKNTQPGLWTTWSFYEVANCLANC